MVAVSVAAVVALLVVPSWVARNEPSGPGGPRQPAPSPAVDRIGTRAWSAVDCPHRATSCAVPTMLNLGGARFVHHHSTRQLVQQRDSRTRTLVRVVSPARGRRWVLVGAQGTSTSSRLSVRLGDATAARLASGALTFIAVPGTRRPVQVTVSDDGLAGGGETLQIEEYDSIS